MSWPEKPAFIFLEDGEKIERRVSYGYLETRTRRIASGLVYRGLEGKRALLIYQDTVEFAISFLACQYAGVVAVPVYYAKGLRHMAKLENIINDAQIGVVLTSSGLQVSLKELLTDSRFNTSHIEIIATDVDVSLEGGELLEKESANNIAFIQYTSGSTGVPKGVVITKENLVANQEIIIKAFSCTKDSVLFSWLPFQHDMGLIGNILHAVYVGFTCVLMSPLHFMQKPQRWLDGISTYRVTHSGAPNFAYDLCVSKVPEQALSGLDLSCWRLAYNGSEPVQYNTLQRFSRYFSASGFNIEAFFPCYGLAEATLMVSGYKQYLPPLTIFVNKHSRNGKIEIVTESAPDAAAVVSSGIVPNGMDVKIVSQTTGMECGDLEEGEITISGNSVTRGYWNKEEDGLYRIIDGRKFLRTGDIGFLHQGQLFVWGRLKEMIISRGQNMYPDDIEQVVAEKIPSVELHGVAAFGIQIPEEQFVIVAEIKRTCLSTLDTAVVLKTIDQAVVESIGAEPYDIVLIKPSAIPRTTSGKLQRLKCREIYREGGFPVIASKLSMPEDFLADDRSLLIKAVKDNETKAAVQAYLASLIKAKGGTIDSLLPDTIEFTAMGIDSLKAMELINAVNSDLSINIDAATAYRENSLQRLTEIIQTMLWLKKETVTGSEIIL